VGQIEGEEGSNRVGGREPENGFELVRILNAFS